MNPVDSIREQGYAVIPNAVNADLCDAALKRIDEVKKRHHRVIEKNADEFGHLYRVVNLHLAIRELADAFAANARGLQACDEFFGEETSLYTTLYYERGSEQDFHRDTPYFCTKPAGRYLGVWLALDNVDDGNGPLRVVPGSHKLPPIDIRALRKEIFGDGDIPSISMDGWTRYQDAVKSQCDEQGLTSQNVHVNKGDVIIWHPELLHGGAPHPMKERSRRSLVMHVTPVGTPVYHIDVFYNPDRNVSSKAPWSYYGHGGRQIAKFDQVDFGHEYVVKVSDFA
jgi:phytanoyl-CoA hydroxylase